MLGIVNPAFLGLKNTQCIGQHHELPHRTLLSPLHTSTSLSKHHANASRPTAREIKATAVVDNPKTQQVFKQLAKRTANQQAGGAGGGTTYEDLQRLDALWTKMKQMKEGSAAGPAPQFVRESPTPLPRTAVYDVAVCGGTLGIFVAAALQLQGLQVAVLERGPLRGREQEWNISRSEINELVELGILTAEDAESCINVEFNPVRVGFHTAQGPREVWTRDVLNLGVSPDKLIRTVRARFVERGGNVLDKTELKGITVHTDGVLLDSAPIQGAPAGAPAGSNDGQGVTARLVLDCMGNFSPVVRQLRWGQRPDGVCLVVGTCARGFENNTTSDLIFTASDIQPPDSAVPYCELFWEAFPAGSGPTDRTTYMFTYIDADPSRPSLEAMMDTYWEQMPKYQGVELSQLEVLRVLFGFFPTYRSSPLPAGFDRLLQVGDASGIQSPLSFGGFGALTRHLHRLQSAVTEAVQTDSLDAKSLSLVNSYNPGLSGAWMMQRAMSVRPGQKTRADFINRLMADNFAVMEELGNPVLRPFLQDVIQFGPLAKTMGTMVVKQPGSVPEILAHVGPGPVADWLIHFIALGAYTVLDATAPLMQKVAEQLAPHERYKLHRLMDAWKYGAGKDYKV